MRRSLWAVTRSAISMAGAALTSVSAVVFLIFVALDALSVFQNPYIGLLIYLALPTGFLLGLLLIPLGNWRLRRRERAGVQTDWPTIDFRKPQTRTTAAIIAFATVLNIVIISMASYGALTVCKTKSRSLFRPDTSRCPGNACGLVRIGDISGG